MNSSLSNPRIDYFAHLIWEAEGQPKGQALRHWDMASRLTTAEVKASQVFSKPAAQNAGTDPSDPSAV